MPLHVQTDRVIKDSGLRTMYEQEKGEKVRRVSKLRGTGDGNAPVQLQLKKTKI